MIDKNIKNDKWYYIFVILLGALLSVGINFIKGINIDTNNYISLFILGIILAVSLVLPGISISYVMLVFGIYYDVILAIKEFDLTYLFKIGISLLIGILLIIKLLSYLLNKYKSFMNNLILGFMVGSLFLIIPKVESFSDITKLLSFIIIGFIPLLILLKRANK